MIMRLNNSRTDFLPKKPTAYKRFKAFKSYGYMKI